jgi:hypothetical protein
VHPAKAQTNNHPKKRPIPPPSKEQETEPSKAQQRTNN